MLVGAHVSTAGGLVKAHERGVDMGCEAIQIFNQSPRMWRPTQYKQPDIKGFRTDNPISNQMLDFAAKQGFQPYPMLDNVIQPEVVTTAQKQLVAAFGGNISVTAALKSMKATLDGLPANRKGSRYSG